jgi:hypothetical protein
MAKEVTYTVLLVFPGYGEERENAEEIIEEAIHHLNTEKDEPGFRFAHEVFAQLEIVPDADEARERLRNDPQLALMILHDLERVEKAALTRACEKKGVPVCHTVEGGDEPPPPKRYFRGRRVMEVVFQKRGECGPRAHTIVDKTLTAPLEGDPEELGDRVGQLIAVMALSVMEVHWRRKERAFPLPE